MMTHRMATRHVRLLLALAGAAAAGGALSRLWDWGPLGFSFATAMGVLATLSAHGAIEHGKLRGRPTSLVGLLFAVVLPSAIVGHAIAGWIAA